VHAVLLKLVVQNMHLADQKYFSCIFHHRAISLDFFLFLLTLKDLNQQLTTISKGYFPISNQTHMTESNDSTQKQFERNKKETKKQCTTIGNKNMHGQCRRKQEKQFENNETKP